MIIAAHQDRLSEWYASYRWPVPNPQHQHFSFFSAPSADDDGSGTVTILETYRGIISAGFQPNRSVKSHWYSAEVNWDLCRFMFHYLYAAVSSGRRDSWLSSWCTGLWSKISQCICHDLDISVAKYSLNLSNRYPLVWPVGMGQGKREEAGWCYSSCVACQLTYYF